MVEANSEYTPLVDSKAERARYVNTYVGFISAFDSCQVCWPALLDSADYAPRKAFIDSLELQLELQASSNSYLENHLFFSLKSKKEDFDWEKFWMDYRKWSAKVPFLEKARDSAPLYTELMSLVSAGDIPVAITLETKFMDLAMRKKYKEAAELIPLIDEFIELKEADEFFLRYMFIVGILGGKKDYMRDIFLRIYMPHTSLDKAEKYLMKTVAGIPDRVRKDVLQENAVKEN
jgi:hypothetical protein